MGKIKLLKENEFINKKIIETSSFVMFYVMFFILGASMLVIKNKMVNLILSLLFCVVFALRIYLRNENLNNLKYYKIDSDDQKEDMKMRAYQLGDLVAIMMYILLGISFYNISSNVLENILSIIFILGIYFFCASFSISTTRFNTFWKTATIFLSTMQGTILVLMVTCFVLASIASLLGIITTGQLNYSLPESFFEMFDYKFIIMCSYCLKEYSNIVIIITTISTILSIVLYSIFIINVPIYQLDKLSSAFKIVSVIMVLMSTVVYFYGNSIYPYIQEYIIQIKNNPQLIYSDFGINIPNGFQRFIENYSKAEITNLSYVLLLPYTISILIANLIMDHVKNRYTKKSNLALDKIIEMYEKGINLDDINVYEKKFSYYGGDKYKLMMIKKIYQPVYMET